MGIVLILIVLPIYIVVCAICIYVAKKLLKQGNTRFSLVFYGILLSFFFTLIVTYLLSFIEHGAYQEYHHLFYLIAAVILSPPALAFFLGISKGFILNNRISNLMAGILFSIIISPFSLFFAGLVYEKNISYFLFPGVCEDAEIKILEDVSGVKNLAFLSDSFPINYKNKGVRYKSEARFILSKSFLEYVETPDENNRGFIQIRIKGKRSPNLMHNLGNDEYFEINPIDSFSADYVVKSESLKLPKVRKWKIYGSRVEIRRTVDDELIAYAQYYWDESKSKMCPEQAGDNLFIYRFITESLNANHPDNKH